MTMSYELPEGLLPIEQSDIYPMYQLPDIYLKAVNDIHNRIWDKEGIKGCIRGINEFLKAVLINTEVTALVYNKNILSVHPSHWSETVKTYQKSGYYLSPQYQHSRPLSIYIIQKADTDKPSEISKFKEDVCKLVDAQVTKGLSENKQIEGRLKNNIGTQEIIDRRTMALSRAKINYFNPLRIITMNNDIDEIKALMEEKKIDFIHIVACDTNHGIGLDGTMPWHIPEDLKEFRRITEGHTMIMGRKTVDSLPFKLPKRTTIGLSRTLDEHKNADVMVVDLRSAIEYIVANRTPDEASDRTKVYICGGGDLYNMTIPLISEAIVHDLHSIHYCDTFYPYDEVLNQLLIDNDGFSTITAFEKFKQRHYALLR